MPDAREPIGHQNPVVGIQRDYVGNGAQGHQIQQRAQISLISRGPASLTQRLADSHEGVEHHAHTGQIFGRKIATRLVRVHDGIGGWQCVTGQVVIGNDDLHPQGLCMGNAINAGDAVVDRDEQVGFAAVILSDKIDDSRCEAVAQLETIGYKIIEAIGLCTE